MSFFLAVDISEAVRSRVTELIDSRKGAVPAKWLRPDKLHITLWYLGHPALDAIAELQPLVAAAAARHAPFRLTLSSAGTFSTPRAAGVLWLGVGGSFGALHALRRDVTSALAVADAKPFVPHLTLARGSATALSSVADELTHFDGPEFEVAHVSLFESLNHLYREVFRVPLCARPPTFVPS